LYDYDIPDDFIKKYNCEYSLLRTCNRIELYIAGEDADKTIYSIFYDLVKKDIKYSKGDLLTEKDAVKHLFSVSSGLESMLIGENEILGQVKDTYRAYNQMGKAREGLSYLFKSAITIGRKVRKETEIGKGKTGIYSLAIDYINKRYKGEKIAVVGSGAEARRFLNGFSTKKAIEGKVFSRTIEHAKALADLYSMDYGVFDQNEIKKYNTIFCAYKGATIYIDGSFTVVDISVPRVFYGKNVIYMEDLAAMSKENLDKRKSEAEKAGLIIDDYTRKFLEMKEDRLKANIKQHSKL
ncbi:MAG: hypothetical protein QXL94_06055, partial [Candidatus Parvarchaeum sp.]